MSTVSIQAQISAVETLIRAALDGQKLRASEREFIRQRVAAALDTLHVVRAHRDEIHALVKGKSVNAG